MKGFAASLPAQLRERGFQARVVSVTHLAELQEELENLLGKNLLNSQFYQERLTRFNFGIPKKLPKTESIIIVAVPRPQTQATFTWNEQRRTLIYPPTYTAYDETTKQVEKLIATILGEKGYKSTGAALPLKLLAARSGLVEYGKNNISYISGMGSFLELAAVFSDLPAEEDYWEEPKMMKRCEGCDLCSRACPTGAIGSDRFLLRAECCLAYHNEKKGEIQFPNWIAPSWHNSIVGCMLCQRACPENKEVLQWTGKEEEFSEKETILILEGVPQEKLPKMTLQKLQRLSLTDYYDRLPRNLKMLLARALSKK